MPTGIQAYNKDERDQHSNKAKALEILRERVYKHYATIELAKYKEQRKSQIGRGDISEKIRTYNWPNNRITDHRTKTQKFGLEKMLSGELLSEFTEELLEKEKQELIEAVFTEVS